MDSHSFTVRLILSYERGIHRVPLFFSIVCHVLWKAPFILAMTAKALKNLGMKRVEWPNSGTEQDILIREARSDPEAFARLYRMHYELVFRYCSRRLFDRHAAEDVTSTVFFKVMNTLETFQGDADGFRRWLYRIAINAVNDHLRTARKRAEAYKDAYPWRN